MPTFELQPMTIPFVLREVIAERGSIWVRAVGHSMHPTIRHGDRVLLSSGTLACRPGDVVAVERGECLVLHRVLAVRDGLVHTGGDACATTDPIVPLDRVFARALAMRRGDRVTALRYTLRFGGVSFLRLLGSRGRLTVVRCWRRLQRALAPGDGTPLLSGVRDRASEERACGVR